MPIPSSQGNHVYVGAVEVEVGNWAANWAARLAEVTLTGSGATLYAPVCGDNSWSASFPHDTALYAEVAGFVPGDVLEDITFKHSPTKGDILSLTTVESVQKTNDTQDVPRIVVTGRGGTLLTNQTLT